MVHLRLIEPDAAPPGLHFSELEIQAMQRAVINLFNKWQVTDREAAVLLGDIAPRTYQRWKKGRLGRVGPDLAARLSNLMGIHKALQLLFADPQRGYGWLKRPNGDFADTSALEIMLNGQLTDLMRIRRYLDASRSPW